MISLAVKYRPKKLSQIIGQEKAVAALRGFLKAGRFNQAVLLSGPSGLGKTSLARILAHSVNCEALTNDGETCGDCAYCKAVEAGHYPDIHELNFSEARGIDAVRDLLQAIEYLPQSRFKVFILDEMHNMTQQAANALLKPLEEPPSHVMFILATTEPQKVPPAIRNRCFSTVVGEVPKELLFETAVRVAGREGVEVPAYALSFIATSASGSVRQMYANLETVLGAMQANPSLDLSTHQELSRLFYVPEESVSSFCDYLLNGVYAGRYSKALTSLYEIAGHSKCNLKLFFDNVYKHHMHAFSMFVDPRRNSKTLYNDHFDDWYESIGDAVRTPQGKAGGLIKLTLPAAVELVEILAEVCEQMKSYDTDFMRLATATTVKMVKVVHEHSSQAYTQASHFHKILAPELCAEGG